MFGFWFLGQTIFEVDKQRDMGIAPDDKIISCCLQALEKYEFVVSNIYLNNNKLLFTFPNF